MGQSSSHTSFAPCKPPPQSPRSHRPRQRLKRKRTRSTKRMQATARRLSVVSATSCARRRLIRVVRPTLQQHSMKLIPKFTIVRCLWIGAILLLVALAGPSLIHLAYRVTTPLSDKLSQTERYHRLANSEAFDTSLSDAQRMRMREERLSLFNWFHARGWNIDEDDENRSWLQPWRELIQHWTTQKNSYQP